MNKDKIAETETNKLVIIPEIRSPMYLPKKPEIMAASNGRNNIGNSILSF